MIIHVSVRRKEKVFFYQEARSSLKVWSGWPVEFVYRYDEELVHILFLLFEIRDKENKHSPHHADYFPNKYPFCCIILGDFQVISSQPVKSNRRSLLTQYPIKLFIWNRFASINNGRTNYCESKLQRFNLNSS